MKVNPWGVAAAIALCLAAVSYSGVKKVRRVNWPLVIVMIVVAILLVWDAKVRAQDIQYCVVKDNGSKMVTQCQNGTVTVVDNINDKVVVCSSGVGTSPRCETLPLKDSK